MTDRELMQMALDAFVSFTTGTNGLYEGEFAEEIEALRARLAQPEQEPVAWASENVIPLRGMADNHCCILTPFKCASNTVPLYTARQQREWQGLTTAERKVLWNSTKKATEFAELVEAKLRERNAP